MYKQSSKNKTHIQTPHLECGNSLLTPEPPEVFGHAEAEPSALFQQPEHCIKL